MFVHGSNFLGLSLATSFFGYTHMYVCMYTYVSSVCVFLIGKKVDFSHRLLFSFSQILFTIMPIICQLLILCFCDLSAHAHKFLMWSSFIHFFPYYEFWAQSCARRFQEFSRFENNFSSCPPYLADMHRLLVTNHRAGSKSIRLKQMYIQVEIWDRKVLFPGRMHPAMAVWMLLGLMENSGR